MMRFSLGVNYWPRLASIAMWRAFDAGELRDDFAHNAGLGLDTVRFFVRWDDFAPQRDAIDPVMLDRLETVVTLAADQHLRTVPALCGHLGGVNFLPAWALDRNTPARPYRTFTGETESPYGAGDIYRGPLLEAQIAFLRAVGTRLRLHPGIASWDIGHAFSNVRAPRGGKARTGDHSPSPLAEGEVANWSLRLADALRETSGLQVTAGTHAGDLTADRNIRLGSLCAPFAFASMQGTTVASPFARGRLDAEATFGILRPDGSERPVAAALSTFAREARDVVPAVEMPMIASDYYYRTLPKSSATLYDAYLGFIEERRTHITR